MVQFNGQVALTGTPGRVNAVHEGTWADAWSGVLNLVSALALIGLTVAGLYSRLCRRPQQRRIGRVSTVMMIKAQVPT